MKTWKTLFYACLLLLIITNVSWFYKGLDMGISMTYQDASMEYQNKAFGVLGELVVEGFEDKSKKDFLLLLRGKYPDGFIVEEQDKITYAQIHFEFKNDSLVEIAGNW